MFTRLLLCYDGSEVGRRALRRGGELAVQLRARADVLVIVPGGMLDPVLLAGATGQEYIASDATRDYRRLLAESVDWLRARGIEAQGYVTSGDTIDQIAAFAQKLRIDLIVLGHYPQPAGGFWWSGPQKRSLAERTRCCVFVAVESAGDAAAPAQG